MLTKKIIKIIDIVRRIIKNIIDVYRKPIILKLCRFSGHDADGDIIFYKGDKYYVHCLKNIVKRV